MRQLRKSRLRLEIRHIALAIGIALSTSVGFSQTDNALSGLLRHADGRTETASLLEIADSGAMKFAAKTNMGLAAERVWRFGVDKAVLRGPYVLLKDGSRLAAPSITGDANGITFSADEIHPGLWDGRNVPLPEIRAVLWKTSLGEKGLSACLELFQRVTTDTLRLDNGDTVLGEYRGIALGSETQMEEEVIFLVRGAESRIAITRCVSLQLADRAKAEPVDLKDAWTLAFRDGSRIMARGLSVTDGGASWRSAGGEPLELAGDLFWKNCTLVEPPRRGVTFLSDLKELSYRHIPVFGEAAMFRRDRSALNQPMRHGGAYLEKGTGMWSNSRLSFAIPQGATRFQAEICIDDAASEQGSAIFRVLAQLKGGQAGQLKDFYRSEVLRGGGDSKQVDVDITGASSLILLVESADQGDTLDLADWLDARFVTSPRAP